MNTKKEFANELKRRINQKQSLIAIGEWAYEVYIDWPDTKDHNFLDLLIELSNLELGPEFAMSYEELNEIADNLIAEKKL